MDEGINYIRKNQDAEFASFDDIETADLCREICYVVGECFHWTFIEKKNACYLKSNLIETGFR